MAGSALPSDRTTSEGRDHIAASDDMRLAVYEWGNPTRPEVLLIHGFSQFHLCFAPQIASHLVPDFRIVAYDQRCHGGSQQPVDPRAYDTPDVWARGLAAVTATKRLRRRVLVGWTMSRRVIRPDHVRAPSRAFV